MSGATASNTFHEVECDMERITHAQPFTQDHKDVAAGLGYVKPLVCKSNLILCKLSQACGEGGGCPIPFHP